MQDLFKAKMKKVIQKSDIVDCYRFGKKDKHKHKIRPIIVEFLHVWKRNEIFYEKSALKTTKVFISELLSADCYKLYREIREKFSGECWTKNGKVVFIMNGRKYFVSNRDEYNTIVG